MSILNHSKKLMLSAFKGNAVLAHTVVCRSFSSVHKARYNSLSVPRRDTPYLSSRWLYVFNKHLDTERLYSEMCSENSSVKSTVVLQEESAELERDHRQKSPETFSLDVLVSLLRQENAVDICVIKVPEEIKYTENFIVVSGVSSRHLRAMALYAIKVYKFLRKEGEPNVKIEGKKADDWICIDFGNMVCHFMLPESREVYELEKLWTLRNFDEQLKSIPAETLPEDFIYDPEVTK
ncbi:mitochondrial assembly of ribosomal large subunit protein 1 [Labrus mixtus]|uniref:mitochondrial assembly of ribosomal large subunit protein 1 n=1 Tax=Labrus mixtus TaxID=508554 RepID=UPI0029C06339|nr:mitochondrial assembly of ribosomal large subunit protein 1 [Labrus mixtus]